MRLVFEQTRDAIVCVEEVNCVRILPSDGQSITEKNFLSGIVLSGEKGLKKIS